MITKTHKITKKTFLLKKSGDVVSTLYVLDKNGNKIKDGYGVHGKPYFQTAICLTKNLI